MAVVPKMLPNVQCIYLGSAVMPGSGALRVGLDHDAEVSGTFTCRMKEAGRGNHKARCGVKDKKEKRLVGAGQDHRGCLFMRKSKSTC